MARYELKFPKMGESVVEATIVTWLKEVGDTVVADDVVLEIATDKVDSEILSEVSGTLVEKLFNKEDVIQVGQTVAIIEIENNSTSTIENQATIHSKTIVEKKQTTTNDVIKSQIDQSETSRFYSPLVRNIATAEGISLSELETIEGTGKGGRVTKNDILEYISTRSKKQTLVIPKMETVSNTGVLSQKELPVSINGEDEIIEMDRMRKIIAHHMMQSIQTSAHVQSFIEVDVTNIWKWREKNKTIFEKREGEKLTFTPIFMEAVAKAIKDFPMINISVQGDYIIKKKNINLGMATALPSGNLIVPVIKNADQLNLVGMAKAVNDLATRAKRNQLKPDDIQGGTYTVTNIGTFGSVLGTPIINQPQVGILALGAIRKLPAVIETPDGDFIGIRYKMFLSHSYDHRVVDGALGGQFVQRIAQYLEAWDINRIV